MQSSFGFHLAAPLLEEELLAEGGLQSRLGLVCCVVGGFLRELPQGGVPLRHEKVVCYAVVGLQKKLLLQGEE